MSRSSRRRAKRNVERPGIESSRSIWLAKRDLERSAPESSRSARAGRGLVFGLALLSRACTPSLEDDAVRADFPRVLAVRAEPAEAKPGEKVVLRALATDGTTIAWSFCVARKGLAETGPIAQECLAYPEERVRFGAGETAVATLPRDACRLFGPDPPIGTTGGRPVDPDGTGGYYQPGLAADAVFSVRLRCNLAGATQEQTSDFEARYRTNANPEITEITINGAPIADEFHARPGDRLHIHLAWPDAAAEPYVAFDPASRAIVDRRESLRVSWLTTSGAFTHSRTDAPDNDFTVAGDATLYFVVRDDRGGVAFRSLKVQTD